MPRSPIALTTHCRSSLDVSSRCWDDAKLSKGADAAGVVDEEVEDAVVEGMSQESIVEVSVCAEGLVFSWTTLLMSDRSSFGLERASATTLALPCK